VATLRSFSAFCARQGWVSEPLADVLARRREPADRTRAIPFAQLERLWRRDDVAVREKALWRLLYETAARAGEVLSLNVEDLELENKRARVRSKGGDVEWLHLQAGSARLLPRLIAGRSRGPLFLADRRPAPARMPAAADLDGLRFVVPRRTIHAGFNRRYFDRRRGATALGTTADHYAGLRTIVIPGTQPDAPYALDALLDPQTSVRPREIMTDTAGYTDIMFALYRLLGYRYSPRLADAGAATLWRLNATDYGPLNPLSRHQINRRLIREHYDDVLRIAGSLLERHTTSSQLIRALRSHTRHLATLAQALQDIGRALKTIHLLDYCDDEHFRRRVLVQLNRGEGRHCLARDVCHGRRGELRQPYRQGQEEQLNALGLIVNSIVLYNTIYTQRALDHIAVSNGNEPRDEDIERLSPLGSDHITLTGDPTASARLRAGCGSPASGMHQRTPAASAADAHRGVAQRDGSAHADASNSGVRIRPRRRRRSPTLTATRRRGRQRVGSHRDRAVAVV
jgi:TnpA family transposase